MTAPTTYEYADGSANVYIITPTSLEYDPVKPEESSTGTYSGGDPKTVTISKEKFSMLEAFLKKGISNTSVHISDRIKGSGQISVINGPQVKQYILQQGCSEIIQIESALKDLLK